MIIATHKIQIKGLELNWCSGRYCHPNRPICGCPEKNAPQRDRDIKDSENVKAEYATIAFDHFLYRTETEY